MEKLITKLVGLVSSENETKAEEVATEMRSLVSDLDKRISEEEAKRKDAYNTRDKTKKLLNEAKLALGLTDDETLKEGIEALKKAKEGEATEAIKRKELEIDALKSEVVKKGEEVELVKRSSEQQIAKFVVGKQVVEAATKYKAKTKALPYLTKAIEEIAKVENGKVVLVGKEGETLREGGDEKTIEQHIAEMFKEEKEANESVLFNIDNQESGGSGDGGNPVVSTDDFDPAARPLISQ